MITLTWISAFLLIQGSQSYVLLTANLDDVQNLIHQVMQSPAVEKVGQYVRRAATLFNQHIRNHNDDRELKESPLVKQVVNVLRSAYTAIKDQFSGVSKDSDVHALRKKPEVNSMESSPEADNTRRRARRMRHNRHMHSRKHYPDLHRSRTRRTESADSEADKKVNTIAENKGDEPAPITSEERREKLRETDEMLALGKNASHYLNTIKEIIEQGKSTV